MLLDPLSLPPYGNIMDSSFSTAPSGPLLTFSQPLFPQVSNVQEGLREPDSPAMAQVLG